MAGENGGLRTAALAIPRMSAFGAKRTFKPLRDRSCSQLLLCGARRRPPGVATPEPRQLSLSTAFPDPPPPAGIHTG